MNTLLIKTQDGQQQYKIESDSMPWQIGTIAQARQRFSFSSIVDVTDCKVEVMNRDGGWRTISMTKDCFLRSQARNTGFSQDTFMGRLIEEGGRPVAAEFDAF